MGFWNKLGKVALVAAPYVAAPFTGGASLMATSATQGLAKKWAQKDAEKAMAKGLAPSKFDRYLTMGGDVASLASGLGAFNSLGKAGQAVSATSKAGKAASTGSKIGSALKTAGKVASVAGPTLATISAMRGSSNEGGLSPSANVVSSAVPRVGGVMPRGGYRWRDNPMNQVDQSSPNLAQSIFQGRQQAIGNQGFRQGYHVNAIGRDDTTYSYDMPRINQAPRRKREKAEA